MTAACPIPSPTFHLVQGRAEEGERPPPRNPIPKTKFRNSARVGVHVLVISIAISITSMIARPIREFCYEIDCLFSCTQMACRTCPELVHWDLTGTRLPKAD